MSKKIIITNFGALTVMQAVQYIVPLIVLPYLVRVVGPAKFGIISFAQAIAYYFALLPDIGTNLYAPREIALIKESKKGLSVFVSGILMVKILVLILTLLLYMAMISFVPQFKKEFLVFLFSTGYIIGESFIPVWFFQGIEKMVNITVGIFIIRILGLISIFAFIRQASDYVYVPLVNSIALIIGVFFMYSRIFFREGIRPKMTSLKILGKIISESLPLFASNVFRNLHIGMNVVVLGFFTSNTVVGYYSAAERLVKVGMGILVQVSHVFYPYTSRMLKISREEGVISMRKGFIAGMLLSVPATIFVITYADVIVSVMFGGDFTQSITLLRILGMLFLITGLSNILGMQVLLPLGKRKMFMQPVIWGFILHLVLVSFLVPWMQSVGAAIAFVSAQVAVALWMSYLVQKLSLGIVTGATGMKVTGLALGLGVFSLVSWMIGLNSLMSMGIFCTLYIFLVLVLRIVDLKTCSIVT
ncbi:MAG TPA: flippase [Syntrophorhabdus sp.]|nr:flippase [Syntrophorhabdus sp.]HQB35878.1 flippase [Syntrophorhabdus sp.]